MEKDNFSQVARILEEEIDSLNEYVKYQKEKNIKLKKELENVSKDFEDDEKIIDIAETYVKINDPCSSYMEVEDAACEIDEVYSKMNVLHMQLCNIIKRFVKTHFPQSDNHHSKVSRSTSRISARNNFTTPSDPKMSNGETVPGKKVNKTPSGTNGCIPKKSLLDILKELIYDLHPNSDVTEYGTMIVDDTVSSSDIEFLISAGIVKRSLTNPALIELSK